MRRGGRGKGLEWGEGGIWISRQATFPRHKESQAVEAAGEGVLASSYRGIVRNRLGTEACFVQGWVRPEGVRERKGMLVSLISTTMLVSEAWERS